MRIACGVEYNGSHYHGWQLQPHANSVQAEVEKALSKIADHPVRVYCAGRTDTGVHATGQVIHFDTQAQRRPYQWVFGGNSILPKDIALTWAQPVSEDFHARFQAVERAYRYIVYTRDVRSALTPGCVSWWLKKADVAAMQAAAACLIGEHDFTSFRSVACQAKSPVRQLRRLSVQRQGDFIYIDLRADGFLHHMVRNIAGVLLAVGSADQPVEWAEQVLLARDRTQAGVTATPNGLYLTDVRYPDSYAIPRRGYQPEFGGVLSNEAASDTIADPR